MISTQQILHDIEEARAFRHPERAMRVLLACSHLRLIPAFAIGAGVGSHTACGICPRAEDGGWVTRLVVDIAETGVLWDESMDFGLKAG